MVAQGLRVVQIENDTQRSMAVQKPRDEAAVYKGAVKELSLAPEFAKSAFYSIPYKDGDRTVNVEGPSIKAAMALARRWGNCANGARVTDDNDERITVEGVFLDYETNVRTLRSVSVPKTGYSKATKSTYRLREDKLNMAIQAGMSKAVRNAILSSLPASLVETFTAAAKKLVAGKGAVGESVGLRIEKAGAWFVKMGAPESAVKRYIDNVELDDQESVLAHLQGLYTSIKDGQANLADVFGYTETATLSAAKIAGAGPVTTSALMGGTK